jgi:anti-sigma regulatory factor (Ser/Thr protein kinase)
VAAIAAVPHVRLQLSSRPENVLLVRQALRGLGEAVALDELELNDLSTAVTEACNNVVTHAYGEGTGPLEVEISASGEVLEVLVRDLGIGIGDAAHEPAEEAVEGGIGLPVIRALSQEASFEEPPEGGTLVRMRFQSAKLASLEPPLDREHFELAPGEQEQPRDAMSIAVGPARLARPVLRRVIAALAARAHFSVERVGETQRLAEELVAHLVGSSQRNRLTAGVTVTPRTLELTVGPLREGSSVDGLAPFLEHLAASHQVVRADSAEVLALQLVERARHRD